MKNKKVKKLTKSELKSVKGENMNNISTKKWKW